MTKQQLNEAIRITRAGLDDLDAQIEEKWQELRTFEVDPDDYEEDYKDMLDDMGDVEIGSLRYNASHVLELVDPVAYRCGLNDYVDSVDITADVDYRALEEEVQELVDQRDAMDESLIDYQIQLEEVEEKEEE